MQTSKRVSRVVKLCLWSVVALPAALFAQAAAAPTAAGPSEANMVLLSAIPDDAAGFIAIRDLKELDADIVAVSAQVGFPLGADGMFPSPLQWLKETLQMTEGLREDGGAAMVLLGGRELKSVEQIEDHLVLYIPASDPKALLTSMGGEEGTDGLYKLDLGGSASLAAVREGFVLVAKAPESPGEAGSKALTQAAKSKGDGVAKVMAPDRLKAYATQDLFVWVNFRVLSEELRKEIITGLGEMLASLGGGMTMGAADAPPGGEAVQQVEKFLSQGEEVSLGLSLNSKVGLGISAYSRVKPDSEMAKQVAAIPAPKEPLLTGLPDEEFIFAAGAAIGTTPESLEQMRKTAEGLAAKVASMDTDEGTPLTVENLKPLIDVWMNLLKNSERVGASVSKIGNAEGEGGLVGLAMIVQVKDAKAWRSDVRESFEKIKKIAAGVAKADGVEAEQIDQMVAAFVWQENAGEVAGASVDVLKIELDKIEAAPPASVQQMKSVVGPEGILLRIAVIGDDQVAVVFGGGEERLTKIVELIKAKQAPLAKSTKLTRIISRMPKGTKVAEGYLSLENLLAMVDAVSTRLESPLPVKLSLSNSAPIAFSTINVDNVSQQMDVLIPSELIVSGAQMVRQQLLPMMMMGGMGGGQGMEEPATEGDSDSDADKDEAPAPVENSNE